MPADITDWYDFVANFVSRYARHDVILGVWNEPNLTLADDDGRQYALLYVNASRARDAIDPDFVVAGPETSHHALASGYLQRALDVVQSWRAIAPQDVVAVHWYGDGPPILTYLDAVHTAAGGRDVWLSETGLAARDVQEQASFYDTMLGRFADEARPPWWTHIIFYRLWDGQVCCSDAILNADFSHRPAFDVYRRWVADSVRRPRDGIVRIPTSE